MRTRPALVSAVLALSLVSVARAHEVIVDPRPQPTIQIALLLDTSNSMDGLINQARTQLWKIVNEFNRCKKDGVAPKLQVSLYDYGNNNLAVGEGYIRMVLPLTTDLDLVSEKLWSLKTNGGSEYCGHAIRNAAKELAWGNEKGAYRAVFIAGNEPFTQGNVDYRSACAEALAKGIIVNTIHCGPENVGREGNWADGAKLGEGKFMNIDQDRTCVAIATPHDEALARLSGELNKTYVPYGAQGRLGEARQAQQDRVATTQPSAAAERAEAKSSSSYNNAGWDLVDAKRDNKVQLESLADDALPKEMQSMSMEQRSAYLNQQSEARTRIQNEIAKLSAERQKFIEAKQRDQTGGPDTLDSAIVKAVREQLEAKDYKSE